MVNKTTNDLVTRELRREAIQRARQLRQDASKFPDTSYVYWLLEPEANTIRYVGVSQCVGSRFKSHLSQARKNKSPVSLWVRSLLERGVLPRCEVVACVGVFGGILTRKLWKDFAVRSLEAAVVRRCNRYGSIPSNLRLDDYGGYRPDLLNVEYTRVARPRLRRTA